MKRSKTFQRKRVVRERSVRMASCLTGLITLMLVGMSTAAPMPQEAAAPAQADSEFVDALWVAQKDRLVKISVSDGSTLLEIPDIKDVRALAVDGRQGLVWAFSKGRLLAFAFNGEFRFSVPEEEDKDRDDGDDDDEYLDLKGNKDADLGVNSNTGTVWLALKRFVIQFDSSADIVNILPLPEKLEALAVDELASLLWSATRRTLFTHDETGSLRQVIELDRRDRVKDISVDAASGYIWVVEKDRLLLLDAGGTLRFEREIKKLNLVASDYQDGAWLASRKTLIRVDSVGEPIFELRPFGKKGEKLLALAADPLRGSVWVADKKRLAEVSADGEVLRTLEHIGYGKKKGNFRAWALFVDVIAPEIGFTAPHEGVWITSASRSLINDSRPTLTVSFTDIGSGVDIETLRLEVNGVELAATCSVQEGSARCVPTADLPEGEIQLSATVRDFNGNLSDPARLTFTVDSLSPQLSFSFPSEGAILNTNTPTLELSFGDTGSGVSTGTRAIQANGTPVVISCTVGAGSASCTPTSVLPEGNITLTATIADMAGNVSAPAQVNFTVDTMIDQNTGNTGTLQGDTTFADGQIGQAFLFDGAGDYVQIPHDPSLDGFTQATLGAWINLDVIGGRQAILSKVPAGNYFLLVDGDRLSFENNQIASGAFKGSTPLDSSTWYHVAATWDGSETKLYVNGVLDGTHPVDWVGKANTAPLNIGQRGQGDDFFDGLIDEVEIYNRALSASEIQAIFEAGNLGNRPEPLSGLISRWQGEGSAADSTGE